MSNEELRSFLAKVDLFAGLSEAALAAVAAAVERRTVREGDYLFREGDPAEFMFVVEAGAFDVLKQSADGESVRLRLMSAREVGGLTSMAVVKTRSASLRANEETSVLTIERSRFLELLEDWPELVRSMIGNLSTKVRGKSRRLATLMQGQEPAAGYRVAVFDGKPYERPYFEELAGDDLAFSFYDVRLGPETARLAAGYPIVCAFVNDDLSRPVIEELVGDGVRLVALRCAGYNNLDLEAAADHGLTVVRVPAYSPHAVAEHAAALLLTLNRKTHRAYNRVREGNFSLNSLIGFDLHGRTAGIVGLGKIGRCLAEILLGFGMRVLAYDLYPDPDYAERVGMRYAELDELLSSCDVLSLHSPLTPETYHLIDADRISRMKPGVFLINTSRGGLVDTSALIEGLKSGRIGAAGLDVYEEESEYFFADRSDKVITDDVLARLMTFPNVLITSHQAFLTEEALSGIAATTVENIRAFLSGKRGEELVNRVELP